MAQKGMAMGSEIVDFFLNKSVFITGVTGFIGKAIVFKLLNSCPGIKNIFVLIRESDGKTASERLAEILNTELFQRLENERPEVLQKLVAIGGDIEIQDLGMRPEDMERLCDGEISVVIHAAASVNLDEPIQRALKANVQGVSNVLTLANKLKNLRAFVHVSTAYSNCNRTAIEEVIYPTTKTPDAVLDLVGGMTEEEASAVTPELMEGRPNTYTFAKCLAEQLVASKRQNLPICIIRPSVVSAAQKEPFPGWIDSWNGASGGFAFILHGLQRLLLVGSRTSKVDLIPVDHVVNVVIAAAWYTSTAPKMGKEPYFVYNCCSGGSNPISSVRAMELIQEAAWKAPFSKAFRYPCVCYVTNKWLHRFYDTIFHRIPYQLMDLKAQLFFQKPRMMKAYRKMSKVFDVFTFFTSREFDFSTENTKKLHDQLNEMDKELFNFDIDTIQWEPYMHDYAAGMRKCLLHEPKERLEADIVQYKRLYVVHCVVRGVMGSLLLAGFILVPLKFVR